MSKTGFFSFYESLYYFLQSVCTIIPVVILKQLHMLLTCLPTLFACLKRLRRQTGAIRLHCVMYPRLHTAIWSSAQNFPDWPTGNFKEIYKILMNFSLVKNYKKKFKPLPWACYAIMTEYVGLFFIYQITSFKAPFFFSAKF